MNLFVEQPLALRGSVYNIGQKLNLLNECYLENAI